MKTMTFASAETDLVRVMDRACEDDEPLIITRPGQPSVVVMSLEHFRALEETAYLLGTPRNVTRLMASIDALDQA